MSSDGSKTYTVRVALVKGFQNHIGFATIRAHGEELWSLDGHAWLSTAGPSAARRKAVDRQTDRGFRIDQMGLSSQTNHQRVLTHLALKWPSLTVDSFPTRRRRSGRGELRMIVK